MFARAPPGMSRPRERALLPVLIPTAPRRRDRHDRASSHRAHPGSYAAHTRAPRNRVTLTARDGTAPVRVGEGAGPERKGPREPSPYRRGPSRDARRTDRRRRGRPSRSQGEQGAGRRPGRGYLKDTVVGRRGGRRGRLWSGSVSALRGPGERQPPVTRIPWETARLDARRTGQQPFLRVS